MPHAIILIGGIPEAMAGAAPVPEADFVIAADSGLHLAADLGLEVDLVIGDLDSVDRTALNAAIAAGAALESHPTDKDATDFELALRAARDRGAQHVTVFGGYGGRLDHAIANVLLLGAAEYADLTVRAHVGPAILTVIRGHAQLQGEPGSLVSLLPVGGPVVGITTRGLRWNLSDDTLSPGSSRGVSNEFAEPRADISISDGTIVAIQPGHGEWQSVSPHD